VILLHVTAQLSSPKTGTSFQELSEQTLPSMPFPLFLEIVMGVGWIILRFA
jgi:hypothetical protein